MITVEHLRKEFTYYRKMTGIRGSLHNVFHRETLTKEAVRDKIGRASCRERVSASV